MGLLVKSTIPVVTITPKYIRAIFKILLILAEPIPPIREISINIIKLKNIPMFASNTSGSRLARIAPPALY